VRGKSDLWVSGQVRRRNGSDVLKLALSLASLASFFSGFHGHRRPNDGQRSGADDY